MCIPGVYDVHTLVFVSVLLLLVRRVCIDMASGRAMVFSGGYVAFDHGWVWVALIVRRRTF